MLLIYGSTAGKISSSDWAEKDDFTLLSMFCVLLHISNILLWYVPLSLTVQFKIRI